MDSSLIPVFVQVDDGSRNALHMFLREKESNLTSLLHALVPQKEFWKARVVLELFWEYEGKPKGQIGL